MTALLLPLSLGLASTNLCDPTTEAQFIASAQAVSVESVRGDISNPGSQGEILGQGFAALIQFPYSNWFDPPPTTAGPFIRLEHYDDQDQLRQTWHSNGLFVASNTSLSFTVPTTQTPVVADHYFRLDVRWIAKCPLAPGEEPPFRGATFKEVEFSISADLYDNLRLEFGQNSLRISPPIPTGLSAISVGNSALRVTWNDLSRHETAYEIFYVRLDTGYQSNIFTSGNRTSATIDGLDPNTLYRLRIKALTNVRDANGNKLPDSAYSLPVEVRTGGGSGSEVNQASVTLGESAGGPLVAPPVNPTTRSYVAFFDDDGNGLVDGSQAPSVRNFPYGLEITGCNGRNAGDPAFVWSPGNRFPTIAGTRANLGLLVEIEPTSAVMSDVSQYVAVWFQAAGTNPLVLLGTQGGTFGGNARSLLPVPGVSVINQPLSFTWTGSSGRLSGNITSFLSNIESYCAPAGGGGALVLHSQSVSTSVTVGFDVEVGSDG